MAKNYGRLFHYIIITNRTTDSKQLCNILTKSYNLLIFFFLIKGEDVKFPWPDITTIWHFFYFLTNRQTILQKQATFMRIEDLPGVFGAIDGTHVHIIAPTENKETYQ